MNAVKGFVCSSLLLAALAPVAFAQNSTAGSYRGNDGYFYPGEPLATNEMRISFMGTSFLPRLSQAANSVFVECGNGENFVFDCGAGVIEKYVAMGVAYSQMDKIFMTHLHADHMSDLMFIYCFGPSTDRFTPLHVWGPTGDTTEEGTSYFCDTMKAITEWHRESFSFLSTGLTNGLDGYDLVAHECPYELINNLVYNSNGVRITHFPAIHDRNGAISFRLEWQGLSMVFSGDTRPNTFMLNQATNLDVLIHEVTLSPEVWAMKNGNITPDDPSYPEGVALAKKVQDCSHTPAKALGYILKQLSLSNAAPRLAVATHFQNQADTTNAAITDIHSWYTGTVALATDLVVLNISTDKSQPIRQRTAIVSNETFYAHAQYYEASQFATPKYTNNMMQFSSWLTNAIIPEQIYTNPPLTALVGESLARNNGISDVLKADGYFYPGEALATNEMRISFMGTSFLPRLSQAANSVFVECGNGENFVFDCGAGVIEKYVAMGVAYSQMDKIFTTHMHADHMSDLMFIYCFGPSTDRFTPLHVWGPTGPNADAPQGAHTNEGVAYFCDAMKALTKWHRESFSFLSTGLTNGLDGYDLVAHECPYELINNLVYNSNGVRITHFPAIHDRDGAISFRLEWQGLSMVFSGDTRPNTFMLNQATNLDVLIHEVTLSPEVWAMKNGNITTNDPSYPEGVALAKKIQDCSHTPAKALGYILKQLSLSNAAPRLAVATHFQNQSDTTNAVMTDIRSWYTGTVALATDLVVLNISTDKSQPIRQRTAIVSNETFYAHAQYYEASQFATPKYTNNLMQLSSWLRQHIIPARYYTSMYNDFNGDGISDLAVYDRATGAWYITTVDGVMLAWAEQWGASGFVPVAGDFDGDNRADMAVYDEATGAWYVKRTAYSGDTLLFWAESWGGPGMRPVAGDYDGDHISDFAVYNEAAGTWYVKSSNTGRTLAWENAWGGAGARPVAGDYDGDSISDMGVFFNTGSWYIKTMQNATLLWADNWGPGMSTVSGDYDGDGLYDQAAYDSTTGKWYIKTVNNTSVAWDTLWGGTSFTPVSGDFNGDGFMDLAVYQEATGKWYVMSSTGAVLLWGTQWGGPGFTPVCE